MLGDRIIIHHVPYEKKLVVENMPQAPDTPGLCPNDIYKLTIRNKEWKK